jgi:peptidyl-prolyl cis-trans isomerase SurA
MTRKNFIGITAHLAFSVVFSFLIACFSIGGSEAAELVDRIVAVVNDDIVSLFELNQMVRPYAEKIKTLGYSSEEEQKMLFKVRADLLDQLIDQKLADQEIKRYKINVNDEQINASIERIKESSYLTDEQLRKALASEGLTMEEYRERVKEQILRTRLVNREIKSKIVIAKEDIKAYYDGHKDKYLGERKYHLRSIVMKAPPFAEEAEKRAVFKKMESILKKLKAGASFKEMADEYSEASAITEGGDLGLFKIDDLAPQLQEALKDLKAGEMTPVIETAQGFQVFYVEEIMETPPKSLEEVSSEIEQTLFDEIVDKKYRSWLENLRKQSHIKIIK